METQKLYSLLGFSSYGARFTLNYFSQKISVKVKFLRNKNMKKQCQDLDDVGYDLPLLKKIYGREKRQDLKSRNSSFRFPCCLWQISSALATHPSHEKLFVKPKIIYAPTDAM